MTDDGDKIIEETSWSVTREGVIMQRQTGGRKSFQLLVRDRGRQKFFINQWFRTEAAAREFLEKLKKEVPVTESTP